MDHHTHVARSAAAPATAMGIGRFVYTPILPLMTAQAGVTPHTAATLATVIYIGYLAGALAGSAWPRLARSVVACRISLALLVVSMAGMPLATNTFEWTALRALAGVTSALVFVIAVNNLLEHVHGRPAHLAGWGFGGIGAGIALRVRHRRHSSCGRGSRCRALSRSCAGCSISGRAESTPPIRSRWPRRSPMTRSSRGCARTVSARAACSRFTTGILSSCAWALSSSAPTAAGGSPTTRPAPRRISDRAGSERRATGVVRSCS
ncbi:membrane hypothetical protein [uncultured Mycobacterium sp.]|uniref:Uncharacterized protein n=1 Tax=uncultured Mycobacterium sp. TaxID=171292 RepID=A0A1Y5PBI0_9MYCO|nr:membrane hypothetical protein [uncultured Mycobacterium sp.]